MNSDFLEHNFRDTVCVRLWDTIGLLALSRTETKLSEIFKKTLQHEWEEWPSVRPTNLLFLLKVRAHLYQSIIHLSQRRHYLYDHREMFERRGR